MVFRTLVNSYHTVSDVSGTCNETQVKSAPALQEFYYSKVQFRPTKVQSFSAGTVSLVVQSFVRRNFLRHWCQWHIIYFTHLSPLVSLFLVPASIFFLFLSRRLCLPSCKANSSRRILPFLFLQNPFIYPFIEAEIMPLANYQHVTLSDFVSYARNEIIFVIVSIKIRTKRNNSRICLHF